MNNRQNFINELFKLVTLLENSGDFIFSQVGLTVKNYQILYLISTGLDTSKSLLGGSYGSKPNMAKKLRFLEENEFITRSIDLKDKRVFRFLITKKGTESMQKISPIYENIVSELFNGIDDKSLEIGRSVIEKCLENFHTTPCPK